MRKMMVVALALMAGWAFADEAPAIVNGGGATLKDLIGKERLVTVVLKDSKAMDRNLRVVDVGPANFSVMSSKGERTAYLFSSVAEIRVQDSAVESHDFKLDANRALRPEEQKIVDRAVERCRELFDAADSNQVTKMRAATFLAAVDKKDAVDYLQKLASSNDTATEVEASFCLYIAGNTEINKNIIQQGLKSGDRTTRAKAALLAGLAGDQSATTALSLMVRDRAKEISAPAARALGLLGVRDVIPDLFKMVTSIDPTKGDAAVFALTKLGGADVIERAKEELSRAEGLARFRLALVLYQLKDATGKELMAKEMFNTPTLQPEVAPILARDGNRDAIQYLSNRLQALYDEKPEILTMRGKAAVALLYTPDPTAVSQLQKLLSANVTQARKDICNMIAQTGMRKLLPILQPIVEDTRTGVSMTACGAVLSVARPDFQTRFVATLEE